MSDQNSERVKVSDQMTREITVPVVPRRVISLVPSQTELLFDLGLDEEIVGVTNFCVHPAGSVQAKTKVGGTKQPRFEVIEELRPDLIIGNKEENDRAGIERLAESYPVWMSDVRGLYDAIVMIREVGNLVGKGEASVRLAEEIEAGFRALHPVSSSLRVAYLIWRKPLMVAGGGTFINDMLRRCGFENPFTGREDSRYPQVTAEELHQAQLDAIFLSSEPFHFNQEHAHAFAADFPQANVQLVDGQMFSWYGSRLLLAIPYLQRPIAKLAQGLLASQESSPTH